MEIIVRRIAREVAEDVVAGVDLRARVQPLPVSELQLFSVATAANLLEVSTDYVYDRIRTGQLAVVELGTGRAKQRISSGELRRFIEKRTHGT